MSSLAFELRGKTALVTGAGGGIGRALALGLAAHGCNLALADVRAAPLAETAALATGGAGEALHVSTHVLDVAQRTAVATLPLVVRAEHGVVHLLVNNAGVALGGNFEQVSEADFDWLFNINFHAVVAMTRAFLPLLHEAAGRDGAAHIVNVSSIFGIIAPAGQAAYSASKFAVRGFSNALRHELEGSGIGVSVVHPGGVATDIARHARASAGVSEAAWKARLARADQLLRLPPAEAARIIIEGVKRGRARIIVGNDAKFAALLERLLPVGYWRLLRSRMSLPKD